MMGSSDHHGKRKLSWYMKAPLRALSRFRDMYVSSLSSCAGSAKYGGVISGGYPGMGMHRSHSLNMARSSNASEEDLRELVRAVSQRKLERESNKEAVAVAKSRSVVIGRIDEDKPMEFDADVGVGPVVFPRSRSAVPMRNISRMHGVC